MSVASTISIISPRRSLKSSLDRFRKLQSACREGGRERGRGGNGVEGEAWKRGGRVSEKGVRERKRWRRVR